MQIDFSMGTIRLIAYVCHRVGFLLDGLTDAFFEDLGVGECFEYAGAPRLNRRVCYLRLYRDLTLVSRVAAEGGICIGKPCCSRFPVG